MSQDSANEQAVKPEDGKKKPEPRRPGGKTKRGPNKWLLRIFRGYDAGGKRIYYSETFHGGSREADDRLVELRNRHKAGEPLKFKPTTFKDFFEKWLEDIDDGERRECTIEQYRRAGNAYLLPAFGKFALTDITDVVISRFYRQMRREKYAPATISFAHVLLSAVLKAAEADDLLLRNPMSKIKSAKKTPKQPKPNPVAMDAGETQAFLAAASSRPEGFMFELAYFLGARPCEYLGLQWPDVDWKARRITIWRSLKQRVGGQWYTTPPKTETSVRAIALTDALVKALEEHRRRQLEARLKAGADWADHKFIFTDEVGEPLKIAAVRKTHKAICAAAKLPDTFTLKVSRHSCASALMNDGVPLKMVSDRLGHASIKTTGDIYGVVDEQRQREVSERVEQLFGIGKK
jgi:integrase